MKKILIIAAIIISIMVINKERNEGIVIPKNSIRFRVIANSNSINDQLIKNNISIYVEEYISNLLKDSKTKDDSLNKLLENKENIENHVQKYLDINNINQKFNVMIGENYFPEKKHEGVIYNAGYYDSLVINLGDNQGMNWWCVVYPPLCLIEEDTKNVEYTTLVEEILSNYNM